MELTTNDVTIFPDLVFIGDKGEKGEHVSTFMNTNIKQNKTTY